VVFSQHVFAALCFTCFERNRYLANDLPNLRFVKKTQALDAVGKKKNDFNFVLTLKLMLDLLSLYTNDCEVIVELHSFDCLLGKSAI